MEKEIQKDNVTANTIAADRLSEINALRKTLEKEEKELKDMFKSILGVGEVFETNSTTIVISAKSRDNLDRKSLEAEFGSDVIAKFVKTTSYLQIDVSSK